MILVYVASPYRSDNPLAKARNYEQAVKIGEMITRYGQGNLVAIIPHSVTLEIGHARDERYWLEAMTKLCLKCEALVWCGWSEGVKQEVDSHGAQSGHTREWQVSCDPISIQRVCETIIDRLCPDSAVIDHGFKEGE